MIGIVGAGPTGLSCANLLGKLGVPVMVIERHPTTSQNAKAISIDGESLRTMQRADLLESLQDVVLPGMGTRYYGSRRQLLFQAAGVASNGHPVKNPFAQPDLERALLAALHRHPHVDVRLSTEVVGLEQDCDGVTLRIVGPDGVERCERCAYVLGADGGRSTVRAALGVEMAGTSFRERWIVIDALEDPHDARYALHVGAPERPHVIVPGRDHRCRYEFLLHTNEAPDGRADIAIIRELLRRYRTISATQVERSTVYTFHALNAERWRVGRVFLLGDAAHMMPPFAGQGLNSGVRDAANITWKLAEVVAGRAGDRLLDSYEVERRPHAQAMINLSVLLGRVAMTERRPLALTRDLLVKTATRTRRGRQYLIGMHYAPRASHADGFIVTRTGPLEGTLLPQPPVLLADGRCCPLDDVLGTGYAVLAVEPSAIEVGLSQHPVWRRLRPACFRVLLDDRFPYDGRWPALADYDGSLRTALAPACGRYLLVRPDRFVVACFAAAEAEQVLDRVCSALGLRLPGPSAGSRPEVRSDALLDASDAAGVVQTQ